MAHWKGATPRSGGPLLHLSTPPTLPSRQHHPRKEVEVEAISLFAELLIIGVHVGVWVFLLALNVLGPSWLQSSSSASLANWQGTVTVLLLSMVYVFGIIFDRLADLAFSGWDTRIKSKIIPHSSLPTSVMVLELSKDSEFISRQYEYARSRIRIARASSLNFGISTILSLTLILGRLQGVSVAEKWGYFTITLVMGSLLTMGAVYAWYRLTCGFLRGVKSNYDFHVRQTQAAAPAKQV
jgi:hypothetical protein